MSVRKSSSSKKGKNRKKRMTIPRSSQKMGFYYLEVGDKKARLTREGPIGGDDSDGGYTLKAFDLKTEPVTTSDLFSDQGARFTAELMKFYGDNFNIYDDDWEKAFSGKSNPFGKTPNVTRGAFYFGEILNDDENGVLYITPEGKITKNFADDNKIATSKDVWYGYTITIEDLEFGRNKDGSIDLREGMINLLDLTNNFYKKFKTDEVIGYIIKTEDGTTFTSKKPIDSDDLVRVTKGMMINGSLEPIGDGKTTYTEVSPKDIFRMKINEKYISPSKFNSAKFGEKFVMLSEAIELNRENLTITMEYNLEWFNVLSDAHLSTDDGRRYSVNNRLDRHPAYVAHSTADRVTDLARLQWLDIVRRDLEHNDYIPIFETNDIIRTRTKQIGLHRREKGFFYSNNRWEEDLIKENSLKTSKEREKDEDDESMGTSYNDRTVVFL